MAPNYKISDIRVPTTAHRQAMAVALFFVCTTFYLSIPLLLFLRVAFELTVCVYMKRPCPRPRCLGRFFSYMGP